MFWIIYVIGDERIELLINYYDKIIDKLVDHYKYVMF